VTELIQELTCGNGEDDVSLVSNSANGYRILERTNTEIQLFFFLENAGELRFIILRRE
jgi:hypothetical protein